MKKIIFSSIVVIVMSLGSCKNYLDVVPDNIPTLDNAFTSRNMAEKYLFTCYAYLNSQREEESKASEGILDGDVWGMYSKRSNSIFYEMPMMLGIQNSGNPYLNIWDGNMGGTPMFQALRTCNIFIERIKDVPDNGFAKGEKEMWIAEVKFLKAYYHFQLLRRYGPIPLIRENLPTSASVEEVQVRREPVDTCFNYIVQLLDEAMTGLPLTITKTTTETGRITKAIAAALKAKVLTEAASPLFNGNKDYALFINPATNQPFFNQTEDNGKWQKAAGACREAIQLCEEAGFELYRFQPYVNEVINDTIFHQMSIRNSLCEPNTSFNREKIWMNTNYSVGGIQTYSMPRLDESFVVVGNVLTEYSAPLDIAEMFYTARGIPIEQDEKWATEERYANRYKIRTAEHADRFNVQEGEQTATLNFDREARFYANLGFDRNKWYGNGKYNKDDQWTIKSRSGENEWSGGAMYYNETGYFLKKFNHYRGTLDNFTGGTYHQISYLWPFIRLADIYLLYAEALNEAQGPSAEVYKYIDKVRERAGLEGVVTAWQKYATSTHKNDPADQAKLRSIIQQERMIEMCLERQRYWDARRWKRAKELFNNKPIQGWNITQETAEGYYRVKTIATRKFASRDYLWPISDYNLSVNKNLVQNPGW